MRITRLWAPACGLVSISALVLSFGTRGSAQHAGHDLTLPVVIDGSEHPELISDDLAYRHFIASVAESDSAPPAKINRRDLLLSRTLLSQQDRAAAVAALRGLSDQLATISEEMQRTPVAVARTPAALTQLSAKREGLLDLATHRVLASISESGRAKLQNHIREHVKRHIVVYGDAPQ